MKISTILFPIKNDQILLSEKRRGHGKGLLNGYGGKIKPGESILDGAIREFYEESGVIITNANTEKVAIIHFFRDNKPTFECHVFFVHDWQGDFLETEEMALPQWYPVDTVPFDRMWDSDKVWLELILKGEKITAKAFYDKEDTKMLKFEYQNLV